MPLQVGQVPPQVQVQVVGLQQVVQVQVQEVEWVVVEVLPLLQQPPLGLAGDLRRTIRLVRGKLNI